MALHRRDPGAERGFVGWARHRRAHAISQDARSLPYSGPEECEEGERVLALALALSSRVRRYRPVHSERGSVTGPGGRVLVGDGALHKPFSALFRLRRPSQKDAAHPFGLLLNAAALGARGWPISHASASWGTGYGAARGTLAGGPGKCGHPLLTPYIIQYSPCSSVRADDMVRGVRAPRTAEFRRGRENLPRYVRVVEDPSPENSHNDR